MYLQTEHVRPVTPDREALMTVCRSTEERGHIIKMAQYDVLEAHNKLDRQEEQKFYADVCWCSLLPLLVPPVLSTFL